LPTLEDNLPNTAIEAISCGVPVVAFNVGGIAEIIQDGQNGRLVPVGDVEGLRFAICDLLRQPEALEKMKQNAREVALRKYKLEYQVQRYVELYKATVLQASGEVVDHAIAD